MRKQHKRSSGSQIEKKMDALLRAEEAFSRQGSKQQQPVCTRTYEYFFSSLGLFDGIFDVRGLSILIKFNQMKTFQ